MEYKHHIKPLRMPYESESTDTIEIQYHRYLEDKDRILEICAERYFKIIQLWILDVKTTYLIAALDNEMKLKIGDLLYDENGEEFMVISFEMLHLSTSSIPDWYWKISFVVLDGNAENVGEYMCKKNIEDRENTI